MRALAFADASARRRLEAILHPMIGAEAAAPGRPRRRPAGGLRRAAAAESSHWRAACRARAGGRLRRSHAGAARDAALRLVRRAGAARDRAAGAARRAPRHRRRGDLQRRPRARRAAAPGATRCGSTGSRCRGAAPQGCETIALRRRLDTRPARKPTPRARLGSVRVPVQRKHPHDAAARASVRPARSADARATRRSTTTSRWPRCSRSWTWPRAPT